MASISIFACLIAFTLPAILRGRSFLDYIQCQICQTVRLEGQVSDCDCEFSNVNGAVKTFFAPLLKEITSRTFFRYFRVDLERPCPFWSEDGHCMMEGCSVWACSAEEIPQNWLGQAHLEQKNLDQLPALSPTSDSDFGWISPDHGNFGRGLARLNLSTPFHDGKLWGSEYIQFLRDTEDDGGDIDDWTDMPEGEECPVDPSHSGIYVNLLENPERFTGYGGMSAWKVWQSIQQENCFGGLEDVCVEKRLFFRLMSGLQASISTHIAREYYFPDGRWGVNVPLFVKAVGSHVDRVNNLYFTFLFVLRAVVKSGDLLMDYPYDTGNKADDLKVTEAVKALVTTRLPVNVGNAQDSAGYGYREAMAGLLVEPAPTVSSPAWDPGQQQQQQPQQLLVESEALEQCRNGFDESILFQVPGDWSGPKYWQGLEEKQALREEFRNRFRNISRIMDCVTCEKCRVWGKLQILGLGTAIKVLLTPDEDLASASAHVLNRQEVIALINTLHQLAKSIEFSAQAADLELSSKLSEVSNSLRAGGTFGAFLLLFPYALYRLKAHWYKSKQARADG